MEALTTPNDAELDDTPECHMDCSSRLGMDRLLEKLLVDLHLFLIDVIISNYGLSRLHFL